MAAGKLVRNPRTGRIVYVGEGATEPNADLYAGHKAEEQPQWVTDFYNQQDKKTGSSALDTLNNVTHDIFNPGLPESVTNRGPREVTGTSQTGIPEPAAQPSNPPQTTISGGATSQTQPNTAEQHLQEWVAKNIQPYTESEAVGQARDIYAKAAQVSPEQQAYLDKLKATTGGYTAPEYQDLQEQYLREVSKAEQNTLRQLKGQQGQTGVRGGLASAQAADVLKQSEQAKVAAEQNLRVKNIDEMQKRLETYGSEAQKIQGQQLQNQYLANQQLFNAQQQDINNYFTRATTAIKTEIDQANRDQDFAYKEQLNNILLKQQDEWTKMVSDLAKRQISQSEQDFQMYMDWQKQFGNQVLAAQKEFHES